MERVSVSSSNIAAVGYDQEEEVLEVEFLNGSVYQYDGVPKAIHDQLISAGSVGKFFNGNVKDIYSYSQV